MNLTPSLLQAVFYNLDTRYQAGYQNAPVWSSKVAAEVPSGSLSTRHAWLNKIPRLREWLGERLMANAVAQGFEVKNRDFELTISVSRNDIEDDQLGLYAPLASMIGEQAAKWPDDLIADRMINGDSSTDPLAIGPDGVTYFHTAHPVKGATGVADFTYANKFAGASYALSASSFNTVRSAMMAFKGEDGKPMGIRPNLLVVPPALEVAARQILQSTFIAPATAVGMNTTGVQSNVLMGMADLLVVPELAGNDVDWYLLDVSKPIKPFVFQLRKAPSLVSRTDPTSENVFKYREFQWGVDSRGAGSYSLPFLACKAHGA